MRQEVGMLPEKKLWLMTNKWVQKKAFGVGNWEEQREKLGRVYGIRRLYGRPGWESFSIGSRFLFN